MVKKADVPVLICPTGFGWALAGLRAGKSVRRQSWVEGKWMVLRDNLIDPVSILLAYAPGCPERPYADLPLKSTEVFYAPWPPQQVTKDVLAEDWEVLTVPPNLL